MFFDVFNYTDGYLETRIFTFTLYLIYIYSNQSENSHNPRCEPKTIKIQSLPDYDLSP